MPLATSKPQIEILNETPIDQHYRNLPALVADLKLFPHTFAGIAIGTGLFAKFDGSAANTFFDGVVDIDLPTTFDAGTPAKGGQVRVSRPRRMTVPVPAGGVVDADLKKPVYAVSGSDYEVQLTVPGAGFIDPIGYIEEVLSANRVVIRPVFKNR